MSIAPTNKNNPCPICENTTGKCRQGKEDLNYWQCMTYADAKKGEIIGRWKSLGATKNQQWAQFKPDNSQEWTEQKRREWQTENQRRQNEKARADEARRRRSLMVAQRHEQYTKLLAELTLHPDDRADLIRRGFTEAQITLAGFKSISCYHPLQSQYNKLLPGVNGTGDQLIIREEGYLCPVRNAEGPIVACQVRLRSLPTTESPRYKWLSGAQTTLHFYPEGSKPEGELPLPVFRPEGKPEGIALAEGTGAKPFLVSQRLNSVVIGSSGGQWPSSETTFKRSLNQVSAELGGTKEIILYPDAGDVCNQADVTQREIDYIKALAPKGCPVRLIVNEYKPERGTVFFDISDKPDGKIETLLMTLEEGTPCFVIDDIKNGVRGCKSIAEYIRSVHPEWAGEIVEINSDTSGDPFVIDYLKNINEASKKTRLLCCSPSVVSGISIENGHFKGVFGLLNGILTVSEASQAIARVRGADKIHLWAAEEGLAYEANRATDPEEIRAWYRRNYEANCRHLLSFKADYQPMTGEWSSPHFDLFCKNAAYRNLCMSRLRERLQARLEEEGYKLVIEEDEGSDMVKEALKQGWNKIELAEARAIAAANILSDAELEALHYRTTPLNPEEKLDLQKTLLYKWFGQELIDATVHEHDSGEILTGYAAMALKNERGVYRQQLENFYLLASDEGEAVNKDVTAEAKQLRHSQGRFPGDIRWRTRQRKAREWLGLNQFLNSDKWWEPKDYAATCQKAKSKASMIKDCLNLGVDKISDGQVFGELMRQLALELDKEWATVKPGQRRFKRRRISAESWNYAQMYVTYQETLRVEREAIKAEVEAAEAQVCDTECASLITPPSIYIEPSFLGGGDQDLSQVEQVEMLTQKLDGSIEVRPEVSQVETCDSECASLITPPSIYIEPSFLGGGDQDLSQGLGEDLGGVTDLINPVESQLITLPVCENIDQFATLVENYSSEVVKKAIALNCDRPALEQYQPGDEVWAYFPQSQDKWLRAVVEWSRGNIVRVVSGFFGMHIERPDLIAPGSWLMSG